ncbi:MAG: SCP2 sterol-binding domain-containing protein [Roseiflexaceae bacterium]|nr:SCP2 sterol-binding domain-containing protein [Roseiflexaceae bacterium]
MSTLTPAEYYATVVPTQYSAAMANADPAILEQPELTASITIDGEGGGVFGLRAKGQEFEYVPGGIADADLQAVMLIDDWRVSVEHGATEVLIDYIQRRKVQIAKSLKGSVTLELDRADGSTLRTSTIFGRVTEPAVTMMMTADDYAAMLRGELNGQMAFMMGRLKFEGSLPLLMAIGALAGK